MDAPTWWADVQQEREDLAGAGKREADDWLGEDIDFVPRRSRMSRGEHARSAQAPAARDADARSGHAHHDADDVHGVFIPTSMAIELERMPAHGEGDAPAIEPASPADVAHELRHLRAADDPFATPPPPPGARRTVQIKGRPGSPAVPSLARRHRPRTASDRVGHRPDRIALWAVVMGAILILLAAASASSQAAVAHRAAHAPAAHHAKVAHVAHVAPKRFTHTHG
jgi:hypothetical protein